jgi:transglutaminase-like putative cysteine protease
MHRDAADDSMVRRAPIVVTTTAAKVYRIEHHTRYAYETAVSTSQHVAWLEPRALPSQRVRTFDLTIAPAPARIVRRTDYFGNVVHQFQLLQPHVELQVSTHSLVEVCPRTTDPAVHDVLDWAMVRDRLHGGPATAPPDVVQYVCPSPQIATTLEIRGFAEQSFTEGRHLLEASVDLMHRIHREFTFDPAATTPATPVSRVLENRRGVCQDFAHIQIACLRSMGLAARYVSGYLLTDPPEGQPRLIGADASHAWLSIYMPDHGWVDLDPTNDVLVEQRHVTIGWGRDYSDVTPLRGVLLGGAEHTLYVGVSVVPVEETTETPAR